MSFDLKSLELFVRAATLGAIGRAGSDLGLSATNASHRIQALEKSLGKSLFHRTTRASSLTAEGEVFLTHAKRILHEVADAEAAMCEDDSTIKGILRATASASLARLYVIPFIPEFVDLHPDLQVDLHLSDSIIDIVEQGFDIAFRIGELPSSSLLARKISDNPMQLVAAPAYLEQYGVPQIPADLEQHRCLPLGRENVWSLVDDEEKLHNVAVSGPVVVNLGDAIEQWVLAGMGIGQASLWHAGPDLKAGRLCKVLPDYRLQQKAKLWAVRPPGPTMPRRVQVFLDFIEPRMNALNRQRYGDLIGTSS